jgi:hypothetical protein
MTENVVWKYPCSFGAFTHEMPKGAEILTFQMQDEQFYVWARVDMAEPMEERRFCLVGTGHSFAGSWLYVGTLQQGPYVWHLFSEVTLRDALRGLVGGGL